MPRSTSQKHVYSLVLSDDVVSAIDRLAYQSGTSRSGMVNQILAEYASFMTPEKRLHTVFAEVEEMLSDTGFQLLMKPSDSMLSLRQALDYKYNPSVRYSVEVWQSQSPSGLQAGLRLKILLRSQNQTLITYLDQYFRLWQSLEKKVGKRKTEWTIEPARYTRALCLPSENVSDEELGQDIASYIQAIDGAMNAFFRHLDEPDEAVKEVESLYAAYEAGARDKI